MKLHFFPALVVFFLFSVSQYSVAQRSDQNLPNPLIEKNLILLNSGDPIQQTAAAQSIFKDEVRDDAIFQKLSGLLDEYYEKKEYNQLSWLAKALGISGDERYRSQLEFLLENSKGKSKRHIKFALRVLDERQLINQVASQLNFVGTSKLAEKNDYMQLVLAMLYTDDRILQIKATKMLADKGIQEPRIYKRLVDLIDQYSNDPKHHDHVAHLIKGLAYSGDTAYRPTIDAIPDEVAKKIKRHIKVAREVIEKQQILNPIYAREDVYTGLESWQTIREVNLLLYSDDFKKIKTIGEVALVRNQFNSLLFDAMNARILSEYESVIEDKRKVDAYAYWTKVFTYFPSPEYIDTVQKVSADAANPKLKKYAATVLSRSGIRLDQVEDLLESVVYNGEPIGSVKIVFLDPEKPQPEKVTSFKKMNLETEIIKALEQRNKYDIASNNSLNLEITSYRVRSKGSKVASNFIFLGGRMALGSDSMTAEITLNLENKDSKPFTINSVIAPKVFENQYHSGEIKLKNDFMIKLMTIFQ